MDAPRVSLEVRSVDQAFLDAAHALAPSELEDRVIASMAEVRLTGEPNTIQQAVRLVGAYANLPEWALDPGDKAEVMQLLAGYLGRLGGIEIALTGGDR